ncbi:YhgE/Pip domain-containing protein [Bifidobacterium leontopitheci]|uniref:Phage infection protein n=1 Tax=Bifidobacterium leontopitheci TaxID=2650774 RepID=A0A6I1GM01_9BIFI|nr:YhgE/Pip domain-containing protein [Bifidobacterium leontopitheci]KAB7790616.1 phage infection protein [Bifidobacterium leontopitheci]
MSTIWKLFTGDIRRITSNIVSVIIVIGLVAIPPIFTWFNVAASWDPFSNTKNLKFAVASVDEGYSSDLIPVKVTVGDQVVNALRANSQLDWTFTTRDDAVNGTKSGKYYAAVVIPKDFSKTMMTFFSTTKVSHAKLEYYTNEKLNALAPKVTGQGADQVALQVNRTFAQTITSTALSITSSLLDKLDDPRTTTMLDTFSDNVQRFASQLDGTADMLDSYASLTDTADELMSSAASLAHTAAAQVDKADDDLSGVKRGVTDISGALGSASDALSDALKTSAGSYAAVADNIDGLYTNADATAADVAASLRAQASRIDEQITQYRAIRDAIAALPDQTLSAVKLALNAIDSAIARQESARDALNTAAANIDAKRDTAAADRKAVAELAGQAKSAIADLRTTFTDTVQPQVDGLATQVRSITSTLKTNAGGLAAAVDELDATAGKADAKLADVKTTLTASATSLRTAGTRLTDFAAKLSGTLKAGDMDAVRKLLGDAQPESIAATLSAPVQLTRKAVFPVANFGSALSPLYTLLALWVGSLLMMVTLKTSVSRRVRAELAASLPEGRAVRPHQLYLGHFGVFAVISLLQSTVMFGGNLLFLHVQSVHPLLYMLTGWTSGLVYAFLIYTFVVSFGNVGKAIGVLLLVVQISGSGAAYPLQLLPGFISDISPFLPVTHSVNMIRAAIAGMYMNDYWTELGWLLAFLVPTLLLGLVLRKPLVGFNRWYVAKVESTKLLA